MEILTQRLRTIPATAERRPDLSVGGLVEIEEMLLLRAPHYAECAHLAVETADRSPKEVAGQIALLSGLSPEGAE